MAIKGFILNACSSFAPAVLSLILMPFYLKVLGQEGLGLMTLLSLSLMVLGVFSAGAGRILQAEIVKASSQDRGRMRSVIWHGWRLYTGVAVVGALLLIPVSIVVAQRLKSGSNQIAPEQIDRCVFLMAAMALITFIFGYAGVILNALDRLADASLITLLMAFGNAGLTFGLLNLWPRVDVFYGVQALVLLIGTVVAVVAAGRTVKVTLAKLKNETASPGTLDSRGLFWRSLYLVASEGLGVLINQLDRMLVARYLPLASLGGYSIGSTLNRLMAMTGSPFNLTVSPNICRLAAEPENGSRAADYLLRISYLALVIVCVVTLPLIGAGESMMRIWLRSMVLDLEEPLWVLRFLAVGSGFQLVGSAFYTYTVARGKVKIGLWHNFAMLLILPLPGYWAVQQWGIRGAALCWMVYGVSFLGVSFVGASRCGLDCRGQGRWWGERNFRFSLSGVLSFLSGSVWVWRLWEAFVSDRQRGSACSCIFNNHSWSPSFGLDPRLRYKQSTL